MIDRVRSDRHASDTGKLHDLVSDERPSSSGRATQSTQLRDQPVADLQRRRNHQRMELIVRRATLIHRSRAQTKRRPVRTASIEGGTDSLSRSTRSSVSHQYSPGPESQPDVRKNVAGSPARSSTGAASPRGYPDTHRRTSARWRGAAGRRLASATARRAESRGSRARACFTCSSNR